MIFKTDKKRAFGPYFTFMKTVFTLLIHLIVTIAKLMRPGGAKSLIAENLVVRHQLIISSRSRTKSTESDIFGSVSVGLLDHLYQACSIIQNRNHRQSGDFVQVSRCSQEEKICALGSRGIPEIA